MNLDSSPDMTVAQLAGQLGNPQSALPSLMAGKVFLPVCPNPLQSDSSAAGYRPKEQVNMGAGIGAASTALSGADSAFRAVPGPESDHSL
jgi:hypothetical protein